jgi:DNA-binding MarR family transcriptional regulator
MSIDRPDTPLSVSTHVDQLAQRFADAPDLPWLMAGASVVQTYKLISQRVQEALGPFDLTMSRYEILRNLNQAEDGTMTARDLNHALLLHPPTMTYTLDWLEERGLVKRQPTPNNRRTVTVRITAKGRKLTDKSTQAVSAIHYGLLGVERDDALAVTQVLRRTHQD